METVGYAEIKKNASTGISGISLDKFHGQLCRVLEFGWDGCVMVIDREATGIATFDKCDIARQFKCGTIGDVITPPDMNLAERAVYQTRVYARKGGYNVLLRNMVIAASIHKGQFTDSFLFSMENNPEYASGK